jgi:hypothetical protein
VAVIVVGVSRRVAESGDASHHAGVAGVGDDLVCAPGSAALEHVDRFGFGDRPEGQQSLEEHSRRDVGSELRHP